MDQLKVRPTKTPKGTRDYNPKQMKIRSKVIEIISHCFKKHGAITIDTPIFELREVLAGQNSKLIYDLANQGGEKLSLRYDLTVPFARYIASNGLKNIKRFHIAKVYRRDNPIMSKGRFREFYQCDYDIAGEYDLMLPDAECLKILVEIIQKMEIGPFVIKVNHRKIIDGIFSYFGASPEVSQQISSFIDKLDKISWDKVKLEMIEEKNLPIEIVEKIGELLSLKADSPLELIKLLRKSPIASFIREAIYEMDLVFNYAQLFGVYDKLLFDLTLVRGLDYYTGIVMEAVLIDNDNIGSIAGGGRYDKLVNSFIPGKNIPAVGFSVGIERIFTILEQKMRKDFCANETYVLVTSIGPETLPERIKICNELWDAGIKAEFLYFVNPKLKKQLTFADNHKIPFVIIIGPDEIRNGVVKLKNMITKEEATIQRSELTLRLKQEIQLLGQI